MRWSVERRGVDVNESIVIGTLKAYEEKERDNMEKGCKEGLSVKGLKMG